MRNKKDKKDNIFVFNTKRKAKTNEDLGKRIFVMKHFEQFVLIFISKTSGSFVDLPFLWPAFERIFLVV